MLVAGESHHPGLPGARVLGQVLPREESVVHELERIVDAAALLPARRKSFRYRGSLTTPPCSEEVTWVVMAEPVRVSPGQLRELRQALEQLRFASRTGSNNRPTQPLNGRRVALDRGSH